MDENKLEQEIDRQEKTLERLITWIGAVDTKVPIIVGFDTAMLGVLAATAPERQRLLTLAGIWVLLGSACLIISLLDCVLASFPRTAGPVSSCVFFGSIAVHPYQNYLTAVTNRTDEEYLNDLTMQCHRNAEIANKKYTHVRRAAGWMFLGMLPWVVSLYLLLKS